jgi:hypothetical protein
MEVEGSNLNAFLESFMGDIPSNDEYADLETNTADLEANTADVMLMSKSGLCSRTELLQLSTTCYFKPHDPI